MRRFSRGVDAHNVGIYSYNIWNTQTNTNGRFPGIAISKSVALPENLGFDYTRENASYIRVRNITLGYNLGPKSSYLYLKDISEEYVCLSIFRIL